MRFKVKVSNYRCFPKHPPAEFELGDGVTAFIGENNAGKSAALRLVHDLRPVFDSAKVPQALNQMLESSITPTKGDEVRDADEVVFNGNTGALQLAIEVLDPIAGLKPSRPPRTTLVLYRNTDGSWSAAWPDANPDVRIDNQGHLYAKSALGVPMADANPVLGALRMLASAVYIPSTRNELRGNASHFDVPHGDILLSEWDQLQRGMSKMKNTMASDIEHSLGSLFGMSELRAFASMGGNQGMQFMFGEVGQHRTDEVGAGLSHAFAALFVVVTKRPSLVLIDEPELSLHPTLQLRFLTELQRFGARGMAFSTHVVGLAMNAADRVYSVTRHRGTDATGGRPWSRVTPFGETPDLSALLGALSFPSYGDPGSRHVLLVEGPTDARLIEVLLVKLEIADHVVCMHMGGNTTILGLEHARAQLSGVKRLCAKVWCLIDSEASGEGQLPAKRREFLELCRSLGISAHATHRRATENYLTAAACKQAFGDSAREPHPYKPVSAQDQGWSKHQASQAAHHMEPPEFGDVGSFLARIAQEVRAGCSPPALAGDSGGAEA
ncbi:MAG: hypothetical protein IT434_12920 [Phycisphaerales bacterium]|nr:hypothetical protein [Phycisphaerales bacterium]